CWGCLRTLVGFSDHGGIRLAWLGLDSTCEKQGETGQRQHAFTQHHQLQSQNENTNTERQLYDNRCGKLNAADDFKIAMALRPRLQSSAIRLSYHDIFYRFCHLSCADR